MNRKSRRHRSSQGGPNVTHGASTAEELEGDVVIPCRLTYLDDPVITGGRTMAPVEAITSDGTIVHGRTDTFEQPPVALLEPTRTVMVMDTRTGVAHEARIEAMISAGFRRVPALPAFVAEPADGWTLDRTPTGVALIDPDGGVVAEGRVELDPRWVSAASSYGSVMVFYGPALGVRTPVERDPATYTVERQADEFRQGREQGICIVAMIQWNPIPAASTTTWAFFEAGTLGHPLPALYVPLQPFKAFGGPQSFGLQTRLQSSAGFPFSEGLAAAVGVRDVDFIVAGSDPDVGFVAGHQAEPHDQFFSDWRDAALSMGGVLLFVGSADMFEGVDHRGERTLLPADGVTEVLQDSFAAVVRVVAR